MRFRRFNVTNYQHGLINVKCRKNHQKTGNITKKRAKNGRFSQIARLNGHARLKRATSLHWRTKMEFLFISSIEKKKSQDRSICHPSSFSIIPLSSRKTVKEAPVLISCAYLKMYSHGDLKGALAVHLNFLLLSCPPLHNFKTGIATASE